MTDAFNIDLEASGFRKNHLDWRTFRDTYNRVSAAKIERGIKPLPLSLLLKLFGPQKVLNTFVITRRNTDDLDTYSVADTSVKPIDMNQSDMSVTNTLNFPGRGILRSAKEGRHQTNSNGSKQIKRDALPVRPVFQRNTRVPGRYFPKPSTASDESLNQTLYENSKERPRIQTPRSIHSLNSKYGFRGSNVNSSKGHRNLRIVKGPMYKATDLSSQSGRSLTWSGKSSSVTVKSMPAINSNGHVGHQKSVADELYSLSFRTEERETTNAGHISDYDQHSEMHSDLYAVKRLKHGVRQVSFPKTSADFTAVLQGRPKTLHRRELTDSMDFFREPRTRTHVDFADTDT